MQGRALVLVLVIGLAASVAATEESRTVVLANGTTLEVAEVSRDGGLVVVRFASGQMQAYPVEEVDLAASGLVPAAVEAPAAAPTPASRSLAAAVSRSETKANIRITDEDVDHVRVQPSTGAGEGEGGEATEETAAAAALLITDRKWQVNGATASVTGTLQNTGTKGVTSVTLVAQAISDSGEEAGSGSTTISQELAPKGEVGFAFSFPVTGRVVELRLRATAAVASFDFAPTTPPQASPTPTAGE